MKKILILEDNAAMLEYLSDIMRKISMKAEVFSFDNIRDAYQCALERTIDLFILDIILDTGRPGDSSGLMFAENIRQVGHYGFTPIIIVTSLEDERLFTYEKLHCYGFVEKPFDRRKLERMAEEALSFPGTGYKERTLFFRKDGIILAVERDNIVYAESLNHVLHIHTCQGDVLKIPYMTIKRLLAEADSSDFLQCSRNMVVNRRFIHNVDLTNRMIRFRDGMGMAEIGTAYKSKVREMLG